MKRTFPSPQWQVLVFIAWLMAFGLALGSYADGASPLWLRIVLLVTQPPMMVLAAFAAGASFEDERRERIYVPFLSGRGLSRRPRLPDRRGSATGDPAFGAQRGGHNAQRYVALVEAQPPVLQHQAV